MALLDEIRKSFQGAVTDADVGIMGARQPQQPTPQQPTPPTGQPQAMGAIDSWINDFLQSLPPEDQYQVEKYREIFSPYDFDNFLRNLMDGNITSGELHGSLPYPTKQTFNPHQQSSLGIPNNQVATTSMKDRVYPDWMIEKLIKQGIIMPNETRPTDREGYFRVLPKGVVS